MMNQKFRYFLIVAMTLATNATVFAQDDDEGPEGPPQASINKYLLLMAVIGIAYAYHAVQKTMKRRAGLN